MTMLNMSTNENMIRTGSSACTAQASNFKINQVVRRSAVTKCSIDDDNTNDSDNENIFLSNFELIMNSNDLLNGEFGFCYIKCSRCDSRLEYYAEDSIGSLIVACSTIVHRESALAAPFILDMLIAIMRYLKQE